MEKRVLVDGTFDLFSIKQMAMLEHLKSLNFTVVVGVLSDSDCKNAGIPIVMTEYERTETLKHSKYIDEIITQSPIRPTLNFLNENRIDLIFSEKAEERHSEVLEKVRYYETNGIDADGIISRVLDQFDEYCQRNLSRGYSCNDMEINQIESTCLLMRLAKHKLT